MLSPNSTLNRSRYLVVKNLWTESSRPVYVAVDTHTEMDVVIAEIDDRDLAVPDFFDHLRSLAHPSIVGIRDHFSESDRHYVVSRPVNGTSFSQLLNFPDRFFASAELENGLLQLTSALTLVSDSGITGHVGITPANVWVTRDNEFKLFFFGSDSPDGRHGLKQNGMPRTDFAFQPLEKIWDGLDRASQTTIAHTYDDGSLDVLESSPDFRADLFSLGAIFYFLITGKMPFDALERSIEILDGKQDPLVAPHHLRSDISPELSEFVVKLMRLRREDRFESFERAFRHLSALIPQRDQRPMSIDETREEGDVLEIPGFSTRSADWLDPGSVTKHTAINESLTVPAVSDSGVADVAPVDQFPTDLVYATQVLLPISTTRDDTDLPASKPRPKFRFFSPVTAVVTVAVLVGVALFGYLSFGNSAEENTHIRSDASSTMLADHPVTSQPVPVPAATQIPTETSEAQTTSSPIAEPEKERLTANPAVPAPMKARPQIADAKPLNKPDGTPSDPAKAKKKVTVDDLINDN